MRLSALGKAFGSTDSLRNVTLEQPREILTEAIFKRILAIERKRTERTGKPLLLLLLETTEAQETGTHPINFDAILPTLARSVRDTDLIGWYSDHITPAIIFTGLADISRKQLQSVILSKVRAVVRAHLTSEQVRSVRFSFHFFPDDWDRGTPECPGNPDLYCDLLRPGDDQTSRLRIKRVMDVAGGAVILLSCAPLFLLTAAAVKLSSRGPVFFRQERVGQYGRIFRLLKFRSMYVDSDPCVHQEFITSFIAGNIGGEQTNETNQGVYKLTRDKRITRVGSFLRRSSLDELPQLLNVLKGDMSLVGPRPSIPYEVSAYRPWHRRRFLEAKPGITGLWQVTGRSSVKFDEMVRLDLRYAASWSPWLDLKILLRTPRAVISGAGAH